MLFISLAAAVQTRWEFKFQPQPYEIMFYKGCNYSVELWGADGGVGCLNKICTAKGGIGAYIRGTVQLETNQEIEVRIGGRGKDGVPGLNVGHGGWNGGGNSGIDTAVWGGDDPSGGGGGGTDLKMNLYGRIIAAGAGSGSGCGCIGAHGGSLNEHGSLNSNEIVIYEKNGGTGNMNGGHGDNSAYCPGSGGGGGWEGGIGNTYAISNHYYAVSKSGSSGYNPTYVHYISSSRGSNSPSKYDQNGYAIINLTNKNDITCHIPRPTKSDPHTHPQFTKIKILVLVMGSLMYGI